MSAPTRPCAGRAGFTLVELLSASTITVLIAGSAVLVLRNVVAVRDRADRQTALQQEARVAVEAVAAALRNAYRPVDANGALIEGADDWRGEFPRDRVRLLTVSQGTVRRGEPESDVREVEFFIAPSDQPDRPPLLMRRTDPTLNDAPDGGGVLEVVAERVVGLNLMYHDFVRWREDWDEGPGATGWPAAVRVQVVVMSEGPSPQLWTASRVINFPGRPLPRPEDNRS